MTSKYISRVVNERNTGQTVRGKIDVDQDQEFQRPTVRKYFCKTLRSAVFLSIYLHVSFTELLIKFKLNTK